MKVEEIHFNHDVNSANSDAFNIRKNFAASGAIQAPEWKNGFPPQPAAYAVAALGNQVTIKAKFSGGPPGSTQKIRAIDAYVAPADDAPWYIKLIAIIVRIFFGNVLGDVQAKYIQFDADGNSALETFTLVNPKLKSSGVGKRTTDWKWQVRTQISTKFLKGWLWVTFEQTQHKIYVVLDIPQGPWDQNPVGNNTQLPWVDALDKACLWALGAKSKDQAAERITKAINAQANQSYTPATMFGFNPPYQLTSYMNHLDSGQPFSLNCTDCADAVTTFANLLGCDLWEGRFFDMKTRKFLTLNGNPAVEADWVSWNWSYHEICWLGQIGQNEFIYDGCLQVDMDDNYNDLIHVAKHPTKMRFGMSDPNDYRYRLIESGSGNLENNPRRRPVA